MPFPHFIDSAVFRTELAFTVIAVIFCLLIYFKTREIYELTKYEGIRHFRHAFLFFGLAYALRFLFSLTLLSKVAFHFILPRSTFIPLFILLLGYFSTISIFYLIGPFWKELSRKHVVLAGHGIAIILSALAFYTRSHFMLLGLQSAMLLSVVALSGFTHTQKKKVSQARILYLLMAVLWLVNLLMVGRRRSFSLEVEVVFNLVSLAVLAVIYHKISKWIK